MHSKTSGRIQKNRAQMTVPQQTNGIDSETQRNRGNAQENAR